MTPSGGGDRLLVKGRVHAWPHPRLTLSRIERKFFTGSLLFVGQSRNSDYPKGKGFLDSTYPANLKQANLPITITSIIPMYIRFTTTKINLPNSLEM